MQKLLKKKNKKIKKLVTKTSYFQNELKVKIPKKPDEEDADIADEEDADIADENTKQVKAIEINKKLERSEDEEMKDAKDTKITYQRFSSNPNIPLRFRFR